jgi:site-specific DNA-methyltransferase (adenine-specific)
MGFLMRGEIIWDKGGASERGSTAWGSWCKASNPILRDVHEYIGVFSKDTFTMPSQGKESGIDKIDFMDWTLSVWHMNPASASEAHHPAPYPIELPRRLILLYTNRGDTVLDPFSGSGTTCRAAADEGRHWIGYDVSPTYCERARLRMAQERWVTEATG